MAIFTNQATLTYNDVVRSSNVATGELLEVLSATKRAVRDQYGDGDRITYVVSILNSGTTAITGLTLNDDLGAYAFGTEILYPLSYSDDSLLYYVNGVPQAAPTVTAGALKGAIYAANIYEKLGFEPLETGNPNSNDKGIFSLMGTSENYGIIIQGVNMKVERISIGYRTKQSN